MRNDIMIGFAASNESKQTLLAYGSDNDTMFGGGGNSIYLGAIRFARNVNLKSSNDKKSSCSRIRYGDYRAKRHSRPWTNESGWDQVA